MVLRIKSDLRSSGFKGRWRQFWGLTQTGQQPVQVGGILRRDGTNFHAQSTTRGSVAYHGFRADLSFLYEKVQVQ